MRKWVVLLICCLLLFAGMPISAAEKNNAIPGLDMKLSVPEGWGALTRDTKEGDPVLADLGLDRGTMLQLFEKAGIYYNAVNLTAGTELVVSMQENENTRSISDLSKLPESRVQELEKALTGLDLNQLEGMGQSDLLAGTSGISIESHGRLQLPEALFVSFEGKVEQNEMPISIAGYITIVNGRQINLFYRSYADELTDVHRKEFEEIVRTVQFEEAPRDLNRYIWIFIAAILIFISAIFFYRSKKEKR
ncbi:hypothetical protein [Marasmitruncus massiliensis]|uniref:hypothetical protein n=1 Tax=Marasmitruncus massiliensis TaxID=1944642 RepID=UPI000C7BDBC6|nr:hypothetical protein [Marasmitruncus massiliensis]